MNKNDLSKKVYETHGGLSYADSQKVVDFIIDTIKGRLVRGEKVLITGFGCFSVMKRKDKKGVNPQTGEPVLIPGRIPTALMPSDKAATE